MHKTLNTSIAALLILASLSCESDRDRTGERPSLNSPSNLVAIPRDSAVDLTWDLVQGAEYKVYYGTQSGSYNGTGARQGDSPIEVESNRLSLTGLTNQTTYYFAVSAVFEGDLESTLSSEVTAMPSPVISSPRLDVIAPETMFFVCTASEDPQPQTINILNIGGTAMDYTSFGDPAANISLDDAHASGSVSPSSFVQAQVEVDCFGLSVGTHPGTLTISAQGALGSPKVLNIVIHVVQNLNSPAIWVYPGSYSVDCFAGEELSLDDLMINIVGPPSLAWNLSLLNAPWLEVEPDSGVGPFDVELEVTCPGSPGSFAGTLTVSSSAPGIVPQPVTINLNVSGAPTEPFLSVSPSAGLEFICAPNRPSGPQTVVIKNLGGGSFTYGSEATHSFIELEPSMATVGPYSQISASVNVDCPSEDFDGALTITANGVTGSPAIIDVNGWIIEQYTLLRFDPIDDGIIIHPTDQDPNGFEVYTDGYLSAGGTSWDQDSPQSKSFLRFEVQGLDLDKVYLVTLYLTKASFSSQLTRDIYAYKISDYVTLDPSDFYLDSGLDYSGDTEVVPDSPDVWIGMGPESVENGFNSYLVKLDDPSTYVYYYFYPSEDPTPAKRPFLTVLIKNW